MQPAILAILVQLNICEWYTEETHVLEKFEKYILWLVRQSERKARKKWGMKQRAECGSIYTVGGEKLGRCQQFFL